MWHEEKLVYDIYLELNKVQPANQFANIADAAGKQDLSSCCSTPKLDGHPELDFCQPNYPKD